MKAQTFTPLLSHSITKVVLKLHKVGSPGISLVAIYATDPAGSPAYKPIEPALAQLSFDANVIVGTEWKELAFATPAPLIANTRYAIGLVGGDTSTKLLYWRIDTSVPHGQRYTRGDVYFAQDNPGGFPAAWVMNSYDFLFEEWGTPLGGMVGLNPALLELV